MPDEKLGYREFLEMKLKEILDKTSISECHSLPRWKLGMSQISENLGQADKHTLCIIVSNMQSIIHYW